MKSTKQDVNQFLASMKAILSGETFDMRKDFYFQRNRVDDDPNDPYTNENTMLALDYDTEDVVEELKSLTVEMYYETIVDNKCDTFQKFYVFGKKIQGRDVYIKLRIKENSRRFVFCISFHFAKEPMTVFPYS